MLDEVTGVLLALTETLAGIAELDGEGLLLLQQLRELSLVLCGETLGLGGRPQETLQMPELLIFVCDGHNVLLLHLLLTKFPGVLFHSELM